MQLEARPSTPDTTGLRFDHLEFWVGNAKQAAYYYAAAFGFRLIAYRGPETGTPDRCSYVVAQNGVRFVFTSGLVPGDDIGAHVARHGDGVRTVAFAAADVPALFAHAVGAGAAAVVHPRLERDAFGEAVTATFATYGDTVHTLVQRDAYTGVWLPGFVPASTTVTATSAVGLQHIDHCVANVGWGEMDGWCDFYARTMGFEPLISFDDRDISTEFTALRSRVMQNASGTVKLPINEPATGKRRSQIEEFLDFYGGPGVQHVAIATDDIVATVSALRANGVELLSAPDTYYGSLRERIGAVSEDIDQLRRLGILVDRDDRGYMLQIFTKPLQDRPTVFFEIIQRRGSLSFGKGNFKALFVSIEHEQAARGTL